MPRPVALHGIKNMHEPEPGTGPPHGNQRSSLRKKSLQILHQPAHRKEKKNRCSKHVGPEIQNKSPRVFQWSGEGGVVSRSRAASANFSPPPHSLEHVSRPVTHCQGNMDAGEMSTHATCL